MGSVPRALALVFVIAVASDPAPVAAQTYTFTRIVDSNDGVFDPDGIDIPSINDAGQVAFRAVNGNTFVTGIFRGSGGPLTPIVDNSGSLTSLGRLPSINNAGEVSFASGVSGGTERIFRGSGGPLVTIATTKASPKFFAFNTFVNNLGSVTFQAELDSFDEGLFHGNGGPLTTVFTTSTSQFNDSFGSPAINDAGQLAFEAGRAVGDRGIFRHEPSTNTFTTIVLDTGSFSTPSDRPSINSTGRVAFHSLLDGGTAEGIFVGDGTTITTVADDSGLFRFFDNPSLNDAGQVAFTAELDDFTDGLFDGPDPVDDRVLVNGQAFDGGTIFNIAFDREGLNNLGQLAFIVNFTDGRSAIYVATPVPEPIASMVALMGLLTLVRPRRLR